MSEQVTSDHLLSEGFAFFRWHTIQYPYYSCECRQVDTYLCVRAWRQLRESEGKTALTGEEK